ncbi:MAG: acetolactate decarboxylase [Ignavibacteriaceae bacterium]
MKNKLSFLVLLIILFVFNSFPQSANNVYQYSIITSLMVGNYDGDLSLNELKEHGGFGLGTFNNLDGELVILDGKFYQVNSEGKVNEMPGETLTPFAVITHFKEDESKYIDTSLNLSGLITETDKMLASVNYIYAVKVEGKFNYIKTRSVPPQQKPYKKLVEVTRTQPVFEFENIEGTLVGFRFPSYSDGINVPGYHFHFISADKQSGGHVLEVKTNKITIDLAKQKNIELSFPANEEFIEVDLSKKDPGALEEAEK